MLRRLRPTQVSQEADTALVYSVDANGVVAVYPMRVGCPGLCWTFKYLVSSESLSRRNQSCDFSEVGTSLHLSARRNDCCLTRPEHPPEQRVGD